MYGFVWQNINTYMNKFKNLKDDGLTSDWLRDNGLKCKTFDQTKLNVVRAQSMAHRLLSQHRDLLTTKQLFSLIEFEKKCSHGREREKITDGACFDVMNINTSVYRKIAEKKRKVKNKIT